MIIAASEYMVKKKKKKMIEIEPMRHMSQGIAKRSLRRASRETTIQR